MFTLDELKKMNAKDLDEEAHKHEIELAKLRLLLHARQSKETAKVKRLRKYLSRIKTLKPLLK